MTGKSLSVSLFSASYDLMEDVQIATGLTVYTDEYGQTWILGFIEVLWLGTSMDHSLIIPNKIQVTGMTVSDDQFDDKRMLDIAPQKVLIPFNNDRTTVYADSSIQNQHDITECTNIIITGEMEWGPKSG